MDFSELSARAPWNAPELPPPALHRSVLEALVADPDRLAVAVAPPAGTFDPSSGWPFHPWPELFVQLTGERSFRCPGGVVGVRPGQTVLIPRGVPHHERALAGSAEACLLIMPRPGQVAVHVSWRRGEDALRIDLHGTYADAVGATGERMCDELAAARTAGASPGELRVLLAAGLWHLLRCVRAGPLQEADAPGGLVGRCLRLVACRLHEHDLGVEGLARDLGVGADHLGRCFRRATGETLVGHLVRRRIDAAADLLVDGGLPVRAAAWACGFRDPLYFSRVFRRLKGVPPRAWGGTRPAGG